MTHDRDDAASDQGRHPDPAAVELEARPDQRGPDAAVAAAPTPGRQEEPVRARARAAGSAGSGR